MGKLADIEAATDQLTSEEKQELFIFLAEQLRRDLRDLPEPRLFSREQVDEWVRRDEAEMRRIRGDQ